tara:strand:- start:53 stop:568 length:516 start_codon:yes stop_codon:yes gene_type:complete
LKKGPIILAIFGIGLAAGLYFAPVKPTNKPTEEETSLNTEEATNSEETGLSPEERVDAALAELQEGNTPPMLVIQKIIAVADEYPKNVKANFTLGALAIQTGQFEKAVGRFETVLEVEPENIAALQFMANSHINLGDTANAKNYLSKAASVTTDSLQAADIAAALEKLNIN